MVTKFMQFESDEILRMRSGMYEQCLSRGTFIYFLREIESLEFLMLNCKCLYLGYLYECWMFSEFPSLSPKIEVLLN